MSARDDEEELLQELGQLMREDEKAMAEMSHADTLGPLSELEQASLTAGLLSRLEAGTQAAHHHQVVRLPHRKDQVFVRVGAALAVAAAALLFLWPFGRETQLPEYSLVLPSPDAFHRGAEPQPAAENAETSRYVLGRELEVLLRPRTRQIDAVQMQVFVEKADGALQKLTTSISTAAGGALIVRIATGQGTDLPRAELVKLHFVIAPKERAADENVQSVASIPDDHRHLTFSFELMASKLP